MQAMNNAHESSNADSSLAINRKITHRSRTAFVKFAAATAFALPTFALGSSAGVSASSHLAQAFPAAGAPTASQYFSTTGRVVSGPFLSEFNRFGLQSIGWPISEQRQENGLTVQYFERVRMEYHPESASS